MKQIILSMLLVLTLLAISTTPTNAASNSTNQVQAANQPTANQLVDKFGTRLDELLTTLASKAGVAVDHFYPIFVFQQRIVGITNAVMTIVGVILAVFLLRLGFKNGAIFNSNDDYEHRKEQKQAEPKMIFGFLSGSIIGAITIIFLMVTFSDTVGQIANPEYYAVQSLVHMVR